MEFFKVNAPQVVSEIFDDGEAAIINLITGNYYSLNATGTKIWAYIENGVSKSVIVNNFLELYEGEEKFITEAVNNFFNEMQREGLISMESTETDREDVSHERPNHSKEPFTLPEIERFGDAQELLLLDPIHDVSEMGFPHQREDAVQ